MLWEHRLVGTAQVAISAASPDDAPVLDRLLQLYQYDFSEIEAGAIGDDGRYHYADVSGLWKDDRYHPFLIRADGEIAGFAVVQREEKTWRMDQFFVLRKHRRRGIGRTVALELFRRFPGRWVVAETPNNIAAQAFWRAVIGELTGGRYTDTERAEGDWDSRPVQEFETP